MRSKRTSTAIQSHPPDRLQNELEEIYKEYHQHKYLEWDPLYFPRLFKDPFDQEIVGLFSSLVAYGNVKQIRGAIAKFLGILETSRHSPRTFISVCTRSERKKLLTQGGFTGYRVSALQEFLDLFDHLQNSYEAYGSFGSHFLSAFARHGAIPQALTSVLNDWKGKRGHLLSSPEKGSACKRWCMYLRWMGREVPGDLSSLDLGLFRLWERGRFSRAEASGVYEDYQKTLPLLKPADHRFTPRALVIPLDVHLSRVSRSLGLLSRKSSDWKAACEVTDSLRKWDEDDPVRYDFALCRIGMFQSRRLLPSL